MKNHIKCPKCHGSGEILDARFVGESFRKLRIKRGISLRRMALEMGISPPYLSDMELGRRRFTDGMAKSFRDSIGALYQID